MGLNFRTSFPTVTSKGGPKCDLLIGLVCDHGTKGTWHREMKPRVYGRGASMVASRRTPELAIFLYSHATGKPPAGLKEVPQTSMRTQS